MHGEASSAPSEERRKLQEIIKEFPLEDIYNCDETGKVISVNYLSFVID
jgi:hypothetical protein